MRRLIQYVWTHSLNVRGGRTAAVGRVLSWQVASRLMPSPIGLPYVDGTFLFAARGMTGATGNWYCGLHEVAETMGMSLGKANYCRKALLDKGLIKVRNFRNSQNKLAYAYLLSPKGVAAKTWLTGRFLKRKVAEYEVLTREIEQFEPGCRGMTHAVNACERCRL